MVKAYFKIDGMKELQKSFDKLGKVPQKHVTSSSKKGMSIVLSKSKANAPYETGNLKKAIVQPAETAK